MKKLSLALLLGLSFNLMHAQKKSTARPDSEIDSLLLSHINPDGPGAVVLVARNNEVIYQKAVGKSNLELEAPMHINSVFSIGSITKQFTAVAILQLMEQGKLSLSDEIIRFIPSYPTQGNKITIEHLLTHTSGIQDYTGIKDSIGRSRLDFTPLQMIAYFKDRPLRFTPGSKYEYSNSGYFLLGYIIEIVSGKTFANYLQENLFDPLEMGHSLYASETKIIKNRVDAYSLGSKGYENVIHTSVTQPYAAGSIMSTTGDLLKWQKGILSYKIIKKETLDKAFTRYKLSGGLEIDYGYGWRMGAVYENASLWHGGLIDGFMSMAIYLPAEKIYVVVLSSCVCNPPEIIALKIAALATGRPSSYTEKELPLKLLEEYKGVYENKKGDLRVISLSGNKIYSQIGRAPKSVLKAYENDLFYFDDHLTTIRFLRNKLGRIEKMELQGIKGNAVWERSQKLPPSEDGINVEGKILDSYVGKYEVTQQFSFNITKENGKLFLQGDGQEKLELFAESKTVFFLKSNGAELEFVKDGTGKITKAILKQGGRETEAKKIN